MVRPPEPPARHHSDMAMNAEYERLEAALGGLEGAGEVPTYRGEGKAFL